MLLLTQADYGAIARVCVRAAPQYPLDV